MLAFSARSGASSAMRGWLVSTLLLATLWGQEPEVACGTWKTNAARSSFPERSRFKSLSVRIERHPKGGVFTVDRVETDGRATSSSTILYLDGEPRPFEDFGCSGIQSSRRADEQTVEIIRMCTSGGWLRLRRHASARPNELILEITEQSPDGRRFDLRLMLERQ